MTDTAKLRLVILLFNKVPAAVGMSGKSACIPAENIWKVILQEYKEILFHTFIALDQLFPNLGLGTPPKGPKVKPVGC